VDSASGGGKGETVVVVGAMGWGSESKRVNEMRKKKESGERCFGRDGCGQKGHAFLRLIPIGGLESCRLFSKFSQKSSPHALQKKKRKKRLYTRGGNLPWRKKKLWAWKTSRELNAKKKTWAGKERTGGREKK